ncbi:hypothetical protein EBR77_04300 [bacterium]|nr:hypothetical protein [bacterium]
MKHIKMLSIVVCVQALLIFFWIYKENFFMSLKRDIQIKKHELKILHQDIEKLTYEIHTVKNPSVVTQYAQNNNLEPMLTNEMNTHDS